MKFKADDGSEWEDGVCGDMFAHTGIKGIKRIPEKSELEKWGSHYFHPSRMPDVKSGFNKAIELLKNNDDAGTWSVHILKKFAGIKS